MPCHLGADMGMIISAHSDAGLSTKTPANMGCSGTHLATAVDSSSCVREDLSYTLKTACQPSSFRELGIPHLAYAYARHARA